MNAIVGLCHFCEAHGPRPLFCTFTTDVEEHTTESSKPSVQCNGCTSLGPGTVLVSRQDDGTIYCSRESVPNPDVTAFLRQAAIRSITCEVSWSKEGGVVYFSDTKGHVLSLMFQLRDTRARGLKRWFSIIVLMKDKMLLLNITPLLSDHMQKIAKELQELADVVYNDEQKICSQRALRLKTGRNDFGQSRSLLQLTGDQEVFKRLHAQFTWMLKAGALTYSETLYTSKDLLQKLHPQASKGTAFETNACSTPSEEECMPLRALENLLSKSVFRILLYCCLTGIDIRIKSSHTDANTIIKGLARLLPITDYANIPRIKASEDQVPSSVSMCVLEETENNNFCCKWPGIIPVKSNRSEYKKISCSILICNAYSTQMYAADFFGAPIGPTVMSRIETAMNNSVFNDAVLHQHMKSLHLEWLGIAKAVKSAVESSGTKSTAVIKLKQVFGVAPHDEQLVNYWMSAFC